MSSTYGTDGGLETISREGQVPETRMKKADAVVSFCRRMWDNDQRRSFKRALVKGLVDGNRPYKPHLLMAAGRADACNANWGTARTYMESGTGAFYDLASEAPGIVGIRTLHGDPDHIEDYCRIMSAEADKVFRNDEDDWDFEMQQSQNEMVLHGRGPFMFEDPFQVFPRSLHDGDLKVPERTPATTKRWEVFVADVDYYPPDLYNFIKDEKSAALVGWDVEFTKKVISNAMDVRQPDSRQYDWEFFAQELKNNSLSYYDDSKVCHLEFVFWKEFDGRITQTIVERESTSESQPKYLFIHVGRYEKFNQCIHPMYYDRGNGGYHHSVTGLGTKLYSPMEYENRLMCNLMDKAFAPKMLFKPTSSEATQRMQLAVHGDYAVLPAGWEAQQAPIQGFLTDGLAMYRTSSELMQSNLSSYRQAPMQKDGNPETKYAKQMEASQASALSRTTINRYYAQLDVLYKEMVRRLCNINSPDDKAKAYQRACMEQGVPKECFGRIESVKAVRVIGEGSPFMRKQSVEELQPIVGRLPEEGAMAWTNDYIAAHCGQAAVQRYNPSQKRQRLPDEQHKEAMLQVASMRVGVPPTITSSQNALTFAGVFLTSCVQAIQSVQQGGPLPDVVKFLELAAPATIAQLRRIMNDPLRKPVVQEMLKQWKKMSKIADELKKKLAEQQQQAKQQQQAAEQQQSDQSLRAAKVAGDLVLKKQKQDASMKLKAQAHKQNLALNDARAASEIHRNNLLAFRE
jgi:hypothetical protein